MNRDNARNVKIARGQVIQAEVAGRAKESEMRRQADALRDRVEKLLKEKQALVGSLNRQARTLARRDEEINIVVNRLRVANARYKVREEKNTQKLVGKTCGFD